MTVLWEQRVGAALFSHHRAPLETRVVAGALVARTRMARWTRRGGIAVLAAVMAVLVLGTVSIVVTLVPLLNAL